MWRPLAALALVATLSFAHGKMGVLQLLDEITNDTAFLKQLNRACNNDDLTALLLVITSGGGLAGSSSAIANEILLCKEKKPIITFIPELCASGAYWIAAATNHVVASPTALIGSVGVIVHISAQDNIKIKNKTSQANATILVLSKGNYTASDTNSNDGNRYLMVDQSLQDTYDMFKEFILTHRSALEIHEQEVWSEGKIFLGRKAQELGMIDEVGSLTNVIDYVLNKVSNKRFVLSDIDLVQLN